MNHLSTRVFGVNNVLLLSASTRCTCIPEQLFTHSATHTYSFRHSSKCSFLLRSTHDGSRLLFSRHPSHHSPTYSLTFNPYHRPTCHSLIIIVLKPPQFCPFCHSIYPHPYEPIPILSHSQLHRSSLSFPTLHSHPGHLHQPLSHASHTAYSVRFPTPSQ